jgi:hypothetical protein
MSTETITITASSDDYWINTTMNSVSGVSSSDFGSVVLTGGVASDTITFTGVDTITFDQYVNVTKAEHNELIDRVAKLEAMLAEEAELRANHPALKMAYDEYRLLLVLAKRHDSDNLTDE